MKAALTEAEKVLQEESADQETVNAATRRLMDAVTALMLKGENTRLDILIQKAEELLKNKEQYTSSSVKAVSYTHLEHFSGIGINNVDDRLRLIYGEKYGIQIESEENRGTTITLLIPLELSLIHI